VALVFVIFDVELAFVYPVTAVFKEWVEKGQGEFAFLELVVFLAILMVGLVYVWMKGDLEWLKRLPVEKPPYGSRPKGRVGDERGCRSSTRRPRWRSPPRSTTC
jgi:NADH-quinone oxidoreductase subunit A